eukprot:scaffold13881_cov124-Isochrysis_galbana.AAC.3
MESTATDLSSLGMETPVISTQVAVVDEGAGDEIKVGGAHAQLSYQNSRRDKRHARAAVGGPSDACPRAVVIAPLLLLALRRGRPLALGVADLRVALHGQQDGRRRQVAGHSHADGRGEEAELHRGPRQRQHPGAHHRLEQIGKGPEGANVPYATEPALGTRKREQRRAALHLEGRGTHRGLVCRRERPHVRSRRNDAFSMAPTCGYRRRTVARDVFAHFTSNTAVHHSQI